MDYRTALVSLLLISQCGCSVLNTFKGPDDYLRHYHAADLRDAINSGIALELMDKSPPGYKAKDYTKENWMRFWNDRIYYIFDHEKGERMKAYKGPTGAEFIRYIVIERRVKGLPELRLEPRNRDRVPQSLIP